MESQTPKSILPALLMVASAALLAFSPMTCGCGCGASRTPTSALQAGVGVAVSCSLGFGGDFLWQSLYRSYATTKGDDRFSLQFLSFVGSALFISALFIIFNTVTMHMLLLIVVLAVNAGGFLSSRALWIVLGELVSERRPSRK